MFKAMYDETKAAVRINDKITNWFHTKAGVGQNDSPTAFFILINSLAKDCEENMQIQLNKLSAWCKNGE